MLKYTYVDTYFFTYNENLFVMHKLTKAIYHNEFKLRIIHMFFFIKPIRVRTYRPNILYISKFSLIDFTHQMFLNIILRCKSGCEHSSGVFTIML